MPKHHIPKTVRSLTLTSVKTAISPLKFAVCSKPQPPIKCSFLLVIFGRTFILLCRFLQNKNCQIVLYKSPENPFHSLKKFLTPISFSDIPFRLHPILQIPRQQGSFCGRVPRGASLSFSAVFSASSCILPSRG